MATLTPTSGTTWCPISRGRFSSTYDGNTSSACEFKIYSYNQTCLSEWCWNTPVNVTHMNIHSANYHSNYSYIIRIYGRVNGSWVNLLGNVKIHMTNKGWYKITVSCDNCTGIRIVTVHLSGAPKPAIGEVSFDYVTAPPPEGKAVITSVEVPDSFTPNEPFNVVVHIRNDGGTDWLFVRLINSDTGSVIKENRGYLTGSGTGTWRWSVSVTLPQTTSFNGKVEAGHET